MTTLIVLSHFQVAPLLAARQSAPETMRISLDLNLTQEQVTIDERGALLPNGRQIPWDKLVEITDNPNASYLVTDDDCYKIQFFSDYLNRAYSLMPTSGAPTMLVSGFPMHRIKDTDPHQDTLQKIKMLRPLFGQVLDTTMGLGYTAIAAAKQAEQVTTIELDPTVVEVCRLNPWSQSLFTSDNITRMIGDAAEVIESFPDGSFQRILHDPPSFSLAGELYSAAFYQQLYRVLTPKGLVFHYIGNLTSRFGSGVARGVVRRLKDAGFRRVVPKQQAFGIIAYR